MPLFRCCLDRLCTTDCRTGAPVPPRTIDIESGCHPDAAAFADFDAATLTLRLRCFSCGGPIAAVVLAAPPRRGGHALEGPALRVSYAHGSGTLELVCHDCGEAVARLAVAGGAETN